MLVYQPSQPVQNSVPVKTFSQWYENILYSPDPHLRGLTMETIADLSGFTL